MNQVATAPPLFELMTALADGLRCRVLLLLERHELTVGELCEVLQLPQSTVSRHLKTLAEAGWVSSRPDGTRRLYRMPAGGLAPAARRLWLLTREEIAEALATRQDARRLESVLAARRSRSRAFFDSAASGWDRMRDELFGQRFYLLGLAALLDASWVVGDLGCGTGPVAEALAQVVGRVVAVDGSDTMVEAARARLAGYANVEVRRGDLESLPIEDAALDAATLILVAHHLADPGRAIAEVARVLRPGGKLLLVDTLPHERVEYRDTMGHIWLGFSEEQVAEWAAAAGLERLRFRPLQPEPACKGPDLFAATAERASNAA